MFSITVQVEYNNFGFAYIASSGGKECPGVYINSGGGTPYFYNTGATSCFKHCEVNETLWVEYGATSYLWGSQNMFAGMMIMADL